MTKLKFDDGMEFDTSGELRVVHRRDGYYVVGVGHLIPCDSREEGEEIVRDLECEGEKEGGAR